MNSRAIASKILIRVLKDRQSLTTALETIPAPVPSVQDKAFIQALCYGVLRHYHALETILNYLVEKPLREKELQIKLLALIGLYQLKSMRVKEHAAVSETVAAVKHQTWAKGLLNAIFRRYLREREKIEQTLSVQIQNQNDHPDWLAQEIAQSWPEQASAIFAANNQQPPLTLRVNLTKGSREAYLQKLLAAGITALPTPHSPSGIILDQAYPVEQLPEFASGFVSVQDAAAQLAGPLLELSKGLRVLDMCAAPGGKTAHILEIQPDIAELWAIDHDVQRLKRVTENLQRLGLQAKIIQGDASIDSWWDGRPFDRILIDAPCTAVGVIRRHPDIKFLRQFDDVGTLQALQQKILEQAWKILAPGGILVYATCSILKQENEQQLLNFIARHPEAVEYKIPATWGIPSSVGRQILPGMDDMDGFYYARLTKQS